jgi:hypothetical protein
MTASVSVKCFGNPQLDIVWQENPKAEDTRLDCFVEPSDANEVFGTS